MWDGVHTVKHDDRAEAMTGPFEWDFVNAPKGHGFSISISRTLKTRDHHCALPLVETLHRGESCVPGKLWTGCWRHVG